MKDRDQYWFPAKRRGWGWGPPTVWQGWAVLVLLISEKRRAIHDYMAGTVVIRA